MRTAEDAKDVRSTSVANIGPLPMEYAQCIQLYYFQNNKFPSDLILSIVNVKEEFANKFITRKGERNY